MITFFRIELATVRLALWQFIKQTGYYYTLIAQKPISYCVGKLMKKLVNHKSEASDLQASFSMSV